MLTVSNGICGLLAIYFLSTQGRDITLGSALILMGFVFDGADGWAARHFGTKHDYGRHLDSVSDAITFCAAPAVLVVVVFTGALGGESGSNVFDAFVLLTATLMVLLGWVRLYRFTTRGHGAEHFSGLPTPAMAFLAIMVCHILNPDRWADDIALVASMAVAILLIAALLMVVPVDYPKVRGRVALVLAACVVAGLVIIGIMRGYGVPGTDDAFRFLTVGALALVSFYVLLGPIYAAIGRREIA